MKTRWIAITFSTLGASFVVLLFLSLLYQSFPAFTDFSNVLLSANWSMRKETFGALSMLYGTVAVSLLAVLISLPIALGSAVFISEFCSARLRIGLKTVVELLAAIPSVVYGLLGVIFLRNWLYTPLSFYGATSGDTLLTAAILLALMILPTITSLSEDAFRCIPQAQRHSARALGLSHSQTVFKVLFPQAKSAIFVSVILALGRALGETVAVYLVIGRQDNVLPKSLFSFDAWLKPGQTITSKLGGSEIAIAYGDPKHWSALMFLGVILWCLVGVVTILSQFWINGTSSRSAGTVH